MSAQPERVRENYKLIGYVSPDDAFWWRQVDKRSGEVVGGSIVGFKKASACINNLLLVTGWSDVDEWDALF